ncbi:MAG: heavy metal translocating P-type ATPase [Rubripirellula sp.]
MKAALEIEAKAIVVPCVHCDLPTQVSADVDPSRVFCCSGCRGAYDLIHGWGLAEFYKLRDQIGSDESAAVKLRTKYEQFDSKAFLGESFPQQTPEGLSVSTLAIHGLHCGACVWLLENAAQRVAGLSFVRVKMSDHSVRVIFNPTLIRLSEIAQLFDRLGYELAPMPAQGEDHSRRESRRLLVQIAIAGFCAANAMWIAIALYSGEASGVAASQWQFLRLVGTGLGLASVIGPGRTFFRGAYASLAMRTPHMDLPIALGLSVGTIVGVIHAATGRGAVYFDSLAVLVFLLLIGRWIQFHQQQRAARSVDLLLRITPQHANLILESGESEPVLVDSLSIGDVIRIAVGESVAVDGTIERGDTTIDRSLLTGESKPVPTRSGQKVEAGTINVARPIDVRVEATGQASRIGRVMQSVAEAAAEKPPIVQLADRIGGVFVVVVTLLAFATFSYWFSSGWAAAAENATSLLIVACPCALALATPLAIAVAIGRAARNKIMIRDGGSLQLLSAGGKLWLDKTGTLTEGRTRVVRFVGTTEGLRHAAAIEQHCCHPIADGIVSEAKRLGLSLPEAELTRAGLGGITGWSEEHRVEIGNLSFMENRGILIDSEHSRLVTECAEAGVSPILIALDGEVVAGVGITDPLKPDAKETVARLQQSGWRVGILSGDHQATVQRVAAELGVEPGDAFAELSPEEKLEIVCGDRADDVVVMVGDGANDAAALAAADVGVAVRGGAEVSLQAAPVFIATGGLSGLCDLISGSERTARLIHRTFALSLSYNVAAVMLAAAGVITPLIAAVLMPISSVSVLALTVGSTTFSHSEQSRRMNRISPTSPHPVQ